MTLYTRNAYGPCITDHHDVTDEDHYHASFGEDDFARALFAPDPVYRQREIFKGRDAEWMRRFNASRMGGPRHD